MIEGGPGKREGIGPLFAAQSWTSVNRQCPGLDPRGGATWSGSGAEAPALAGAPAISRR
jgi:hypothetical protein